MVVCVGYELTGLARGGEQLSRLKRNYAKAVELLVELASLQVRTLAYHALNFNVFFSIPRTDPRSTTILRRIKFIY